MALAASCAVPSVEELERFAAEDARNTFFKGLFLGVSVSILAATVWISILRSKRVFWSALLLVLLLPIELGFLFAEAMSYCGNGGIDASYYLLQLLMLAVLFVLTFVIWRGPAKQSSQLP